MKENRVAELLTKLRKENGYTQSGLADKLGVTFQAVSKWERGENLPDAYTLTDLAKIYGITVDEILNGKLKPISDEEKSKTGKYIMLIFGVMMIVVSPISIFIIGEDNWRVFVPMIIITIAIGIGLIIFATMGKNGLDESKNKSRAQKRREDIIYSVAAGIFFIVGFMFNIFHYAWVIFIFAYALTLILDKDEKEKDA